MIILAKQNDPGRSQGLSQSSWELLLRIFRACIRDRRFGSQ